MDLPEMIAALRQQRACLDEAIVSIERLLREREPRRGRPPLRLKRLMLISSIRMGKMAHAAMQ